MRVLVTGGGGFIGRRVVAMLVAEGHTVTVLDRSVAGLDLLEPAIGAEVRRVIGETPSEAHVSEAIAGQDMVAHLAAGSSFLMYEERPVSETAAAIVGFHTVVDAAVQNDVGRIVYLSTSAVYEGNRVPYREDMPLHPPDLKALAKRVNEDVAAMYVDRYGIETVALRPFSVYGPGEVSKGPYANVASLFTWAMAHGRRPVLWGDGSQTRDFIYVDDVAEAVLQALRCRATGAFNVGTGTETRFDTVIDRINGLLGRSLKPVRVDIPITIYAARLLADTTHARDELGFVAKVTFEQGLREVLASFQRLPEREQERLSTLHERFREGVAPLVATGASHGPPTDACVTDR
jgi:nucleoside-diphosphate-sugar epimerase